MKITRIERQKKHPDRRSIWVDGKFRCGVSEETLLRFDLQEGQAVSEAQLHQLTQREERTKAKQYVLDLLGYRMRSEKELRDRLKGKGYSSRSIEDVIEDLRTVDLINDLEFARAWVRNRMATNPRGVVALRSELWKKGVAGEVVDEVMGEFSSTYDETEVALKLVKKRFGTHPDLLDANSKRRLMGFLGRRGFSYEICRKVVEGLRTQTR